MIDYCSSCNAPMIRGECARCASRHAWFWVFVLIVAGCAFQACRALAEPPIPPCAWTVAAKHELGKMVQLETCSEDEYRTIGWALARRWRGRPAVRPLTFAESVTAFSHILRRMRAARAVLGPLPAARRVGCSRRQRGILGNDVPISVSERLEAWARGELDDGCVGGRAWNWSAPPGRRNIRCPGFNHWLRMPADVVLEEGRCG